MNARIVLFLGVMSGRGTQAEKARYALAHQLESAQDQARLLPWSVLVAEAEAARPGGRVQVVVIGSQKTYDDWESYLIGDAAKAGYKNRDHLPIGFLRYDDQMFVPTNSEAFWGFFDDLRQVLSGEPISALSGFDLIDDSPKTAFSEPADYVLMDITRGFRAAPFIGASALAFVRASDRRHRHTEDGCRHLQHRIYYAAREAESDDGITPVWDLTPFVDGVELSDALDAFTRHGRADDLSDFFRESQNQAAKDIAEPMKQFADDLLLMRIPNLLTSSAKALHDALATRLWDLKQAYPPLKDDLDELAVQVDRLVLQGDDSAMPISEKGVQAVAVLAERLWKTGRYADLYNLLRESLLTAFSVVAVCGDKEQPGSSLFKKQREKIEGKCRALCPPGKPQPSAAVAFIDPLPPIAQSIADQFGEVAEHRNDVAHCSMGSEPRTEKELREVLRISLDTFRQLVASLKLPQGGP